MDDAPTLPRLLRHQAAARGAAPAVSSRDERVTYAELHAGASRVAHALLADGLEPGTRVALLARDSVRVVTALFGVAQARGVVLGVNWRLTAREITYLVEDAEARVLLVAAEYEAVARDVLAQVPALERVICVEGDVDGWTSWDAWLAPHADDDPGFDPDPEECVVQMYTSGTTGLPKGVMLPHRSFFAVIRSMRAAGDPWLGFGPDDVTFSGFPTFHIGGLWWAMTTLEAGAELCLLDTFVGWRALELLQRRRVTKACMVAAMMQMVLSEPDARDADFSALDCIVYGGSPITVSLLERGLAEFGCRFAQIYGLTETGNTAVCLRPEDHTSGRRELLSAAGRPYPGVRAKVIDADGSELAPREVGEICLHSPANMLGYWKRDEATAETLVDGWVHTGDAGFLDEQGYVFVCDRVKDMIITAGENVYPAEIESVLAAHAGVAEVAVIGVPHDTFGEVVHAVVVPTPDAPPKPSELIAHCRGQLASFKEPRSIEFADELPRTSSGKVKKAVLREPHWAGRERRIN